MEMVQLSPMLTLHEPPVICEICQKEFNAFRIVNHRKWHNEIKENNRVDRSNETEALSPSEQKQA